MHRQEIRLCEHPFRGDELGAGSAARGRFHERVVCDNSQPEASSPAGDLPGDAAEAEQTQSLAGNAPHLAELAIARP